MNNVQYQLNYPGPVRVHSVSLDIPVGSKQVNFFNIQSLKGKKVVGLSWNKDTISRTGKAALPAAVQNSAYLTLQNFEGTNVHNDLMLSTLAPLGTGVFWFEPLEIAWDNSFVYIGNNTGLTGAEALTLQVYYQD